RPYLRFFRGNRAASAAAFDAVRPIAERLGNGWHLGFDGCGRGFLALAGGDPAGAVAVARAGQAAARRTGESNSDACATWALCNGLADHGRPAEALRELTGADERFARRPGFVTEAAIAAARAYVLSSVEDDEAAAVAVRRCITAGAESGIPFIAGFGIL